MSFGIFEAAISSEQEVGIAKQAAADKMAAAIYDVREKLGPALFAASSLEEFRDRVAMMKNDQSLFRIIGAHTPPVTGTVRRIVGKNSVLEKEFKAHLARRVQADDWNPDSGKGWIDSGNGVGSAAGSSLSGDSASASSATSPASSTSDIGSGASGGGSKTNTMPNFGDIMHGYDSMFGSGGGSQKPIGINPSGKGSFGQSSGTGTGLPNPLSSGDGGFNVPGFGSFPFSNPFKGSSRHYAEDGLDGSAGVAGAPTGGSIDTDASNNGGKGSFAETGKFPTQVTSRRTTACYPGCEKNEAHAKKYHKDKEAGKINYRDNFTNQVAANVSRGEAAGYRQGHSAEQGQSRAVRGVSPTTSLDAKTGSDHLAGRLLRGLRYLQSAGAVGEPSGQRQGGAVGQEDWGTALQRRAAIQRSAEALRFALSELPTAVRVSDRQSLLADLRGVLRTAGAPEGFIDHVAGFEGTQDLDETFEPSEGPLVPTDNFDGYLNSVDQGAPGAVERNFTSAALYRDWCEANDLSPMRLSSLDAYADRLSDGEYMRLASHIQRLAAGDDWPSSHNPATHKGQPKSKLKDVTAAAGDHWTYNSPGAKLLKQKLQESDERNPDGARWDEEKGWHDGVHVNPVKVKKPASVDPMRAYINWCQANDLTRVSARNVAHFAGNDVRLCIHLAQRMRNAIHAASRRQAATPTVRWDNGTLSDGSMYGEIGSGHYVKVHPDGSWVIAENWPDNDPGDGSVAVSNQELRKGKGKTQAHGAQQVEEELTHWPHVASRRTAAPDYLQKADDALTQLLNQKAQEFQETIAPLQQALVTVQQAEQLQQQANPLNVLPPPGTVNVLPGQAAPGQVGQPDPSGGADPSAAAAAALAPPPSDPGQAGLGAAPGGGVPTDQSGPPPAAGAEGALPPELMQATARRRGGQGKGRPPTGGHRTANGSVFDLWERWKSDPNYTQRGGEPDYEAFAKAYNVGERAITKLRQQHASVRAVNRYIAWCTRRGLRAADKKVMTGYHNKVGAAERRRLAAALRRIATEDNDPYGGGFNPNSDPSQRPPSNSVGKGGTPPPVETPPPNPMPNIVPPGPAQVGPWPVYGAPGNNTAGDIPGMIGLPTVPGMGFQPHASRRTAKEPVNIAEEAATSQWRKMDSALSAKGYKYDKASKHWTKPGARPVKNHWQIKASWSRLADYLDVRQAAADADLLKAEGDEISTIGEYQDFAQSARALGDDAAANAFEDIIDDEREHVQRFDDQLDRVAANDDWQPVVQGKYVYPGSEGFRPKDDHSQCRHPDACVVQHPELLKKKQSSRKQAWMGGMVGGHGAVEGNPRLSRARGIDSGADQAGSGDSPYVIGRAGEERLPEGLRAGATQSNQAARSRSGGTNMAGRSRGATGAPSQRRQARQSLDESGLWDEQGERGRHGSSRHPLAATEDALSGRAFARGRQSHAEPTQAGMAGVLDVRQGAQAKVGWTGWGPSVAPKTRQVDNWEWNERLAGYTSGVPQRFSCHCGSLFDAPGGYHKCGCGKTWNSYVIGQGGPSHTASADLYIVREIPVRPGVIVASHGSLDAGPEVSELSGVEFRSGKRTAREDSSPSRGQERVSLRLSERREAGNGSSLPHSRSRSADVPGIAEGGGGDSPSQRQSARQPARESGLRDQGRQHAGHDPARHTVAAGQDALPIRSSAGSTESGATPTEVGLAFLSGVRAGTQASGEAPRVGFSNRGESVLPTDHDYIASIYKLTDPGELDDEGEDDGRPTMKATPADWHRRDKNQRWTKAARRG